MGAKVWKVAIAYRSDSKIDLTSRLIGERCLRLWGEQYDSFRFYLKPWCESRMVPAALKMYRFDMERCRRTLHHCWCKLFLSFAKLCWWTLPARKWCRLFMKSWSIRRRALLVNFARAQMMSSFFLKLKVDRFGAELCWWTLRNNQKDSRVHPESKRTFFFFFFLIESLLLGDVSK